MYELGCYVKFPVIRPSLLLGLPQITTARVCVTCYRSCML